MGSEINVKELVMKGQKFRCLGFLAALLVPVVVCAGPAEGDTSVSLVGLAWGAGVGGLKSVMGPLEPDVCGKADSAYYSAKGWSCEGYVGTGRRLGTMEFDVHLHMAESTYTLTAISMKAKATGSGARRQNMAKTCADLKDRLSQSLGSWAETVRSDSGGTLLTMHRWSSQKKQTTAVLVCRDIEEHELAEVQVELEHVVEVL